LKKIFLYETVLQIYVRFMPRIGIDADIIIRDNALVDRLEHPKYSHGKAKICSLHESQL